MELDEKQLLIAGGLVALLGAVVILKRSGGNVSAASANNHPAYIPTSYNDIWYFPNQGSGQQNVTLPNATVVPQAPVVVPQAPVSGVTQAPAVQQPPAVPAAPAITTAPSVPQTPPPAPVVVIPAPAANVDTNRQSYLQNLVNNPNTDLGTKDWAVGEAQKIHFDIHLDPVSNEELYLVHLASNANASAGDRDWAKKQLQTYGVHLN